MTHGENRFAPKNKRHQNLQRVKPRTLVHLCSTGCSTACSSTQTQGCQQPLQPRPWPFAFEARFQIKSLQLEQEMDVLPHVLTGSSVDGLQKAQSLLGSAPGLSARVRHPELQQLRYMLQQAR